MSDAPAPTADNLKIAQQLLSAMSQISVQLENQTKAYRAQAELLDGIVKAQAAMGNIDPSKMQEISDALNKGQKSADELANAIKGGTDNAAGQNEKLQQGLTTLQKTVIVMGEFVNGFKAGFNLSKALLGNLLRIGSVGLKGIMGVGKALLSIPGSILDFFQSNTSGGTDPWREALEELRDKFGSLKVGTSKAVLGMMDNVNQFNDSGLRLGRVFGYGRAGAAAAMKEFMKIAEEMGPLAMRFMDATKGISGQLLVLTKATGLTGEALRSLQISADNGGESVATATQRMSVELVRAQRTFNISVKEMGRDLEVMMKDVGTFGVMTRDTMIKTSVYARKLGLSMEALKKVMDKTLNFEDTANMAGGLAEAFNMNIDAMKMMKAQTPVEKLDQLREAFFRTGKNIDQMSIAERKHLSNLTGLSEEETRIAFAQKNRAMTGAALDAQMKKSQKTQITQEQAMHELADSIKRLTQSGSGMKGGFFEMFFKGFEAGITRSRDFRKIAREIQQDLRIVWRAGRDVGRMFVMFFPGIQNMFGGLKDMLNPAKFRQLMDKIRNIFGTFFIELQTDPRKGFENFMERMKKAFFDMFSSDKAGGSRFLQGLKKFWGAIGNIFVQGLRWLLTKTKDGIKFILDSIKNILHNPRGIKAGFKELFDSLISPDTSAGVESGIMSLLGEIMQTLKTEILPVLQELWTVIVDFFKDPAVQNTIKNIGMAILGYMFGPAVFMSIIRGSLAIGFMLLKTAFTAWIEQVGTAAAWEVIKKGMGRLFSGLFSATTAVYLLIAAFAALFVGFAVAPEATGKIVDWITDFIGGLGEMIGKLVGYIIKGAVYLIGGIIYATLGFAFDTQRWLGYANRAAIALLQAFASVGMMIVKFFGDMVAGVLEALGFPGAAAAVRNFTKSVVDEIKDFIKNATEYFDIFSQMVEGGLVAASDSISEFLQPLISLFFEVGSVISDLFSSIWGGIKSLFNTISEFVGGFIDAIIKPIFRTISSIGRSMSMILDMIISGIISFAGTVVDILTWPGRQIFALFSWALDQIMSILSPFIETAKGYFTEFSDYVIGKFDSLVGGISSAWDTVVSTISEGIDDFGSGIDRIVNFISIPFTVAGTYIDAAGAKITSMIDSFKRDFDLAIRWVTDHNPFKFIADAAEAAERVIRRIHGHSMNTVVNNDLNKIDASPFQKLSKGAMEAFDSLKTIGSKAFQNFKSIMETGLKFIKDDIIDSINNPVEHIKRKLNILVDLFKNTFETISQKVSSSIELLKKHLTSFLNDPVSFIQEKLNNLKNWIIENSPFPSLTGSISGVIDTVIEKIEMFRENINTVFRQVKDNVILAFTDPVQFIKNSIQSYLDIVTGGFKNITDIVDNVKKGISTFLKDPVGYVKEDLKNLSKWVQENNPFALIGRAAEGAAAIIDRIHGHSQAPKVMADLNKIKPDPIHAIGTAAEATSHVVTQSFSQAARNSNTHLQQIQRNSTTASAAAATAVAPNPQALQQASAGISQASTAVNQLQNENIQNNAALLGLFGQLRDVINGMVNFVKDAFRDLTPAQATNVKAGVEVISSLFTSIKTIVDIVGGLKGSNGAINVYTTVIAPLFGDNGILSYLFDPTKHSEATAFKNMMKSGGLIEGFTTSLPANFNDQIIKLTSVFNFIKSIGESISALNGSGAPAGDIYSRIINPLIGANGILSYLFDPIKHSEATAFKNMFKTHGLIGGFLAVLPPGFSQGITKLTNFFNSIKTMFESVKAISDMPNSAALTTSPLAVPLANLALIIDNIKQDNITANGVTSVNPLKNPRAYFDPLTAILAGIAGKETILTNVKNVVTELLSSAKAIAEQPIVPTSPDLGTSLANMTSVLETIDAYFGPSNENGNINNLLDNIHRNTKGRVSHDLSIVVERYNALSRDLANINPINIDASLTRISEGLGHNRQLQIENAAANITINLAVKLTAEDIEKSLYARVDSGPKSGRTGGFMTTSLRPNSGDTIGQ